MDQFALQDKTKAYVYPQKAIKGPPQVLAFRTKWLW
jgi:hypothetical protein